MAVVQVWTGLEAHVLRNALRMSVRAFADHLGVAPRTIGKWGALGADTVPHPDTQAILDTALARATPSEQQRFDTLLASLRPDGQARTRLDRSGSGLDYEAWAEDLDRTVIALSWQNFGFARELLNRWLTGIHAQDLDDKGLYLFGRSLTLLGDFRADQGELFGPQSAHTTYNEARGVFVQLDIPRRVAQLDLSLAVVTEMSGNADAAARQYDLLAVDNRLSARDRGRAALWVGTALSKQSKHVEAAALMTAAARNFETLGELDDWSSAQQKLALAYRGSGDLTNALRHIDIANSAGRAHSPLQQVQLNTATAHILLSDPETKREGMARLDIAGQVAVQHGLGHQIRSIQAIRRTNVGDDSATAAMTKESA